MDGGALWEWTVGCGVRASGNPGHISGGAELSEGIPSGLSE